MKLNPHHPTTNAMDGNWHKLLAIAMVKLGHTHLHITVEDIDRATSNGCNITVQELPDGLHFRIVDDEEAQRLARQHGGVQPPAAN